MKKILPILIFSFVSISTKADCFGYGTSFWPNSGQLLNQNSLIFLETDDSSVLSTIISGQIFLKSGTSHISVTVIDFCRNGLNLLQIILKPVSQLSSGLEYSLSYKKAGKMYPFKITNRSSRTKELVKWKTNALIDVEHPLWIQSPVLIGKKFIPYGCGPERRVTFSFIAKDNSKILIKATIVHKQSNKQSHCYIWSADGFFDLGHTMCYGAYKFENEDDNAADEYQVTFQVMDESGNYSEPSKSITFIQPNEKENQ